MKVRLTLELETDELMAQIMLARKDILAEHLAQCFPGFSATVNVEIIPDTPANDNVPAAVPIKKEGTSVPSIKIAA